MPGSAARPHELDSVFVRRQLELRTVPVSQASTGGRDFVLYWMQGTHRLDENWALRLATLEADRRGLPLLIHQGLDPTYEHASDRIHDFILRNAGHLARDADKRGIRYQFVLRRRRADDRRQVDRLAARAALVVTDLCPTVGIAERTARFAARTKTPVIAVESSGVIPFQLLATEEYAARTIRPKIARLRDESLEVVADRPPRRTLGPSRARAIDDALGLDLVDPRSIDVTAELASCEIDHDVPPVALAAGGDAACERLTRFLETGLANYDERRRDPNDIEGTSRLSAHLHFGQISAAEVARAALASPHRTAAEQFLDELLTWRELSLNLCLRNPRFRMLRALPTWVRESMARHASDPREVVYSRRELEEGRTHAPLWNAAQRELAETGLMHNAVRQLWGKAVLTWKTRYGDALRDLIHLNDRWALDGRDPNSYANILWCFGKFDRPFARRPVWGTIRPMSLERAAKRFDVAAYARRWLPEAGARA